MIPITNVICESSIEVLTVVGHGIKPFRTSPLRYVSTWHSAFDFGAEKHGNSDSPSCAQESEQAY